MELAFWLIIAGTPLQRWKRKRNERKHYKDEGFLQPEEDSRTCYPRRAFNQKTTDGSWTYAHLSKEDQISEVQRRWSKTNESTATFQNYSEIGKDRKDLSF
jgi:hypothetical protein